MELKQDSYRKFTRIEIIQQARLEFDDTAYDPCRIRDISLTGMFICCTVDKRVGDECIIRYSQTCTSSHFYFRAKGKVVREEDDGLAVEFVSMPIDSYMLLQTTLLYEAINPLEIGLELPEDCPFEITVDIAGELRNRSHAS